MNIFTQCLLRARELTNDAFVVFLLRNLHETNGIFDKYLDAYINFMFCICLLEDPGFIEIE